MPIAHFSFNSQDNKIIWKLNKKSPQSTRSIKIVPTRKKFEKHLFNILYFITKEKKRFMAKSIENIWIPKVLGYFLKQISIKSLNNRKHSTVIVFLSNKENLLRLTQYRKVYVIQIKIFFHEYS